jgi:methylated-DNA-[protein]-cysteine S-methyltransferase
MLAVPPVIWQEMNTPFGRLLLAGDGYHLTRICFQTDTPPMKAGGGWLGDGTAFLSVRIQLAEYFAGTRRDFELPLAMEGTVFQRAVWRELTFIPYGTTICYSELARRVGNARASRAVGLANGANPLPIVVPCHRVIGANGSLTGFGGGLEMKRRLLELEGAACVQHLSSTRGAKSEPS